LVLFSEVESWKNWNKSTRNCVRKLSSTIRVLTN
jgi:hypothetical protein